MTNLSDNAGHALSGATPRAVDHLETALHQLRCYRGDPVASVDAALDASPELGWLLLALLACEIGVRIFRLVRERRTQGAIQPSSP